MTCIPHSSTDISNVRYESDFYDRINIYLLFIQILVEACVYYYYYDDDAKIESFTVLLRMKNMYYYYYYYYYLVRHANTVPLLDLRQLLMTFVRMLTYSRPDMFF
jgi:hypothetical protein